MTAGHRRIAYRLDEVTAEDDAVHTLLANGDVDYVEVDGIIQVTSVVVQ